MKIAVAGEKKRLIEFRIIISEEHYLFETENFDAQFDFSSFDLIVDLNADDREEIVDSVFNSGKFILFCAVKKTLHKLTVGKKSTSKIAGINALPTFLSRTVQEISFQNKNEFSFWKMIFELLNWEIKIIKDKVGMVTPRILFMIINEACFTLEEDTASITDIDSGMKLGTAYPIGPFEWADKIGLKNIYETIENISLEMNDNRHKICPLLKNMYLEEKKFYLG